MTRAVARCYLYRGSRAGTPIVDPAKISDLIAEPGVLIWFDIVQPEAQDLALIQEEFELHPLAIEDAIKEHERSKIES